MKKLQKIQFFLSVIPYLSTPVILFISLIELKRYHAPLKKWTYFFLVVLAAVLGVSAINEFWVNTDLVILRHLLLMAILAAANILLVILQVTCCKVDTIQSQKHKVKAQHKFPWKILLTITSGVIASVFLLIIVLQFLVPEPFVDSNGPEDTSLITLSLDDLLSSEQTGSHWSVSSGGNGAQTNVSGTLTSKDYDETYLYCKRSDGVTIMQATNIGSDSLVLHIDSTLTSGNMEIIVMIDDEYYCHVPVNSTEIVSLEHISGKTVLVKIGAEGAEIDLTVTREY